MMTMTRVSVLAPGDTVQLSLYDYGVVVTSTLVTPAPGDELVYDDFRGSGKPYYRLDMERSFGREPVVRYQPANGWVLAGEGF